MHAHNSFWETFSPSSLPFSPKMSKRNIWRSRRWVWTSCVRTCVPIAKLATALTNVRCFRMGWFSYDFLLMSSHWKRFLAETNQNFMDKYIPWVLDFDTKATFPFAFIRSGGICLLFLRHLLLFYNFPRFWEHTCLRPDSSKLASCFLRT